MRDDRRCIRAECPRCGATLKIEISRTFDFDVQLANDRPHWTEKFKEGDVVKASAWHGLHERRDSQSHVAVVIAVHPSVVIVAPHGREAFNGGLWNGTTKQMITEGCMIRHLDDDE